MPTLVNNLRAIRGPITSVPVSGVSGISIEADTQNNMILISLDVSAEIRDIQLVNSLPASPDATVLYLIPET